MMINEIKKLYEDMKINIRIRKGLKEDKVKKFDNDLLFEMSFYDYYNLPILLNLFNQNLGAVSLKEVSKVLAYFLAKRGKINLLEARSANYYLIEFAIGDKKYIYDVLTRLVYDKSCYYEINSDVSYKVVYSQEEFLRKFEDEVCFLQLAEESTGRTKLVKSLVEDYQNGYADTVKSLIAFNDYCKKDVDVKLRNLTK